MSIVTIEDIAKKVGCAPGTVSRALNNRKGVRQETKTRILEAAQKMGYQPNAAARSLVSRQTNLIALVIPDLTEPIISSLALAADEYLFERGYITLLCTSGYNADKMRRKMAYISQQRVAGVLLRPCDNDIDDFIDMGLPLVLLSHVYDGPVSYVDMENETAGYLGTQFLLQRDYRRVAFFGGPLLSHVTLRFEGYCRALREYGLEANPAFHMNIDYTVQSGYEAMRRLMEMPEPPDSIFSCNDRTAIGAFLYCMEHGVRIPEDFGIMGFNDDEMTSWPLFNITTIQQPTKYMGELAARILLDQIEKNSAAAPQKVQIYPKIIERGTTRPLRV